VSQFTCQFCRKTVFTKGGTNRRRWCSNACRSKGGRLAIDSNGNLPAFLPSPLNILTTDRYQQCVQAGTHRAGRQLTGYRNWRGYDFCMTVCDTCGVPLPDESVGFRLRGEAA